MSNMSPTGTEAMLSGALTSVTTFMVETHTPGTNDGRVCDWSEHSAHRYADSAIEAAARVLSYWPESERPSAAPVRVVRIVATIISQPSVQ